MPCNDADHHAEELIEIADGPFAETTDRIRAHGPALVAEAAMAEIAERMELTAGPSGPVRVQFELRCAGSAFRYVLDAGDPVGVEAGCHDDPWVTIRQDLGELVHELFGPESGYRPATREVVMKDEPGPRSWDDAAWHVPRRDATLAAHRVLTACRGVPPDLTDLAVRADSDKWGGHWYTPLYHRYFAPLRDRRVRLLEIGVGGYQGPDSGGASLRMWKRYFRRGLVYGVDVFPKPGIGESRLRTLTGDQSDAGFLREVSERHGPFDIVIDDGSHINEHVIASFRALFPLLRTGGLYVVEDVQTSYWPGWGGDPHDLTSPGTSMGFFKDLADGVNHQESAVPRPGGGPFDRWVTGVHFHHNLVVVEKGYNSEQGSPSWVPREEGPTTEMTATADGPRSEEDT